MVARHLSAQDISWEEMMAAILDSADLAPLPPQPT